MERNKIAPSFRSMFASAGSKAAPPSLAGAQQKKENDPFATVPPMAKPYTSRFRIPGYKNVALIIAGFSVLLLAPMIEFFSTTPREDRGALKSGLNFRGEDLGGADLFEDGVAGIAPGSLVGQDENITPLVARDPASLILRYWNGEEEVKPEPRPRPRPARQVEKPDGWKNALAASIKRGVSKAAVTTRRPMPAGKLAGKLSSLSSGSGGGSRAATMPQLSAPTHSGLLADRNTARASLSRVAVTSDYRGTWRSGTTGTGPGAGSGSSGGFLQSGKTMHTPPGGFSRDGMNIPGVEGGALSRQSSAAGGQVARDGDSAPISLTSAKDSSNISINQKEDLSYARRKMEMQKAIELKWEKKKYDEIERKKMLEQIAAQTASQAALKVLDALLKNKKEEEGGGG